LTPTASHVEEATLTWLASLGYTSIFGPDIAPRRARRLLSRATAKVYFP